MFSRSPEVQEFDTNLLFVHGAWHGAWCWDGFTDYFSERGFSYHALDLLGHGERRAEPGLIHSPSMLVQFSTLKPNTIDSEKIYRDFFLFNAPESMCKEGFEKAYGESSRAMWQAGTVVRLRPDGSQLRRISGAG